MRDSGVPLHRFTIKVIVKESIKASKHKNILYEKGGYVKDADIEEAVVYFCRRKKLVRRKGTTGTKGCSKRRKFNAKEKLMSRIRRAIKKRNIHPAMIASSDEIGKCKKKKKLFLYACFFFRLF